MYKLTLTHIVNFIHWSGALKLREPLVDTLLAGAGGCGLRLMHAFL